MNDHIYDAVIVGAGFGGLGTAAQFARSGRRNFLVLEREADLGGVWRDNTYPGAACDTQSVIYCYSHFPHLTVERMYAGRDELLGYLRALADEYALHDHILLNSGLKSARWDDCAQLWWLRDDHGRTYLARVFVPALGQLGTPKVPSFPGLKEFSGVAFHSARWRHDIALAGKRVASVGAAASAVQYVPEIAAEAAHLVVFQRSANYILPRNQQVFTAQERARHQDDPAVFQELRERIHAEREAGFARTRLGTGEQETGVREALKHLRDQVANPALRRKLTPDHEFGCKRILRSDDYYPALNRPNVTLETSGIEGFTETGIVTHHGKVHDVDVVVFGTGFASQTFVGDIEITGRNGRTLADRWDGVPEAYLGMLVDGFPNLFLDYGPNTNLNHNSVVTMLECQQQFIAEATEQVLSGACGPVEAAAEEVRDFNAGLQAELSRSAFSSDCSSWYKNADGRVVNNWSGTVDEYHRAVAAFATTLSGEALAS
ncbi:flavin-containing monooxygenase [Streptomyces thinghirensis]|uniref:NAD(P)/FAD-dependent oxidoreductase n=1 Tax=Streptomyces thinghirensis TaxID=551547 RepID=A0ABP9TH47_9ACTN